MYIFIHICTCAYIGACNIRMVFVLKRGMLHISLDRRIAKRGGGLLQSSWIREPRRTCIGNFPSFYSIHIIDLLEVGNPRP